MTSLTEFLALREAEILEALKPYDALVSELRDVRRALATQGCASTSERRHSQKIFKWPPDRHTHVGKIAAVFLRYPSGLSSRGVLDVLKNQGEPIAEGPVFCIVSGMKARGVIKEIAPRVYVLTEPSQVAA